MKVMSPGSASRMPATSRISIDPSPTTSPFSSAASCNKVRVTMAAASSACALGHPGVEFLNYFGAQVQAAIRIDDGATGGVENDVEALLSGELLHDGADLLHHLAGGALVLLSGAAGRAPDVLHESLVVRDRLLQCLFLLLTLEGRQDRALVADLGAELIDHALLLGRFGAPGLDLAIEGLLSLLRQPVLLEDLGRVDESDPGVGGPRSGADRSDQCQPQGRTRQAFPRQHPVVLLLEGGLSEQEVTHPSRAVSEVAALEPVADVEADVAEQGDLESNSGARAHLEVERASLLHQVPHVSSIEEQHTVEWMGNRKLLLQAEQRHEAPAGIADQHQVRVAHHAILADRPGDGPRGDVEHVADELVRHHHIVVVAAQRIRRGAASHAEALVLWHRKVLIGVLAEESHPTPHHRRDALQQRREE